MSCILPLDKLLSQIKTQTIFGISIVKLEEYLRKNNIEKQQFAKMIGVSQSFFSLVINRKRDPSLQVIRRIIKVTNGQVNISDLVNMEPPKREKIRD